MKRNLKRVIAVLCALALIAGNLLVGSGEIANASSNDGTSSVEHEWSIVSSETGENIVNGAGSVIWYKQNVGVTLPKSAQNKDELQLYVKVWLKDEKAVNLMNTCYVELANEICDVDESYWHLGNESLHVGENEIILNLNNANKWPQDCEGVVLSETINWFRIFTDDNLTADSGGILLYEAKLKNSNVGVQFGADDTYYRLSNTLNSAPNVIKASVKMDEEVGPTEWTLIEAGEDMAKAAYKVPTDGEPWQHYSQTTTTGTVEQNAGGPEAGTPYTEFVVGGQNAGLGGMFGFWGLSGESLTTPQIPTKYNVDDLTLSFWLWTEDERTLPTGTIKLNNGNWIWDGGQSSWNIAQYVQPQITSQGWNYIELNLSDLAVDTAGFDYRNITFLGWVSDSTPWTEDGRVRFTDIKLVVKEQQEEDASLLGTIVQAGADMEQAVAKVPTEGEPWQHYTRGITSGTVSVEEGPGIGTAYTEFSIQAQNSGIGGMFGFWGVCGESLTTPEIPSQYDADDLALSFWIWTEDDRPIPTGTIKMNNGNWIWSGGQSSWNTGQYVQPQITKQGWNYIELDLADLAVDTAGFDYRNITFLGWIADSTPWTESGKIRLTDMKLIVKDEALNGSGNTSVVPHTVTVSEVDHTALSGNKMIFSNTNATDTNAYALYVTDAGYPALLWGTSQYTLDYDVRTGEWSDIKVVLNSDDKVEFYINEELKGTSEPRETDVLGAFEVAHSIGADGLGGQLFDGYIADLQLFSDEMETTSIGNWNLENLQDSMTIPDLSTNANNAVFAGVRTEEWVMFDEAQGKNIVNSSGVFIVNDANLNLPSTASIDDITFHLKVWLKDEAAVNVMKGCYVELTNNICDQKELEWSLANQNLVVGENAIVLRLTEATPHYGAIVSDGYGAFTLEETVNYFRIHGLGASTDTEAIKLYQAKLVQTTGGVITVDTDVKIPTLFSDGMMFQQNKPMNIWGYDTVGEDVTVTLYQGNTPLETKTTTVNADGRWDVALSARAGSYTTYTIDITVGSGTQKTLHNVLVGELWIAAGQSNMELTVYQDMQADAMLAEADDEYLRIFLEPSGINSIRPVEKAYDIPGGRWGYGNNQSDVGITSSLAYNFAINLREQLDIPVGIINTPRSGSMIEAWLSLDAVKNDEKVKSTLQEYDMYYSEDKWATTAGHMATVYNERIAPLEGMNIAGVLWYQGEHNSNQSEIYDIELALLKYSWGKVFGYENGDMPFIFSQVAPFSYDHGMVNQQHLGYLAMYMQRGWKLCDPATTAMLTVYDLPLEHIKGGVTAGPIHPRNKVSVGERFFQAAWNMVYGGNEEYTAPVYKDKVIKDGAIYITFDRVGKGLKTTDGTDDIHGFTIAGADGVYVNAKAEFVDKDTIKIWNERVAVPENVIYAFDNYNQGANLCNSSMIPASPFRTVELNDTTYQPDTSISYFTAQDWMYADQDVWVYDSTNTANWMVGYRPSFKVDGGTYTYDSEILTEGSASLKVTYGSDYTLSPILSYESVKQDWGKFKNLSVSILNPNAGDVEVSMLIESGNKKYIVSTVDGADSIQLAGSSEDFTVVTFDLTTLKLNGVAVDNASEILSALSDVSIRVASEEAGEMYFDDFSFGMTDEVVYEDEDINQDANEDNNQRGSEAPEDVKKEDSNVNTGDASSPLWYLILILSATGISVAMLYKKRKEERK